jgi:hypothetical protein
MLNDYLGRAAWFVTREKSSKDILLLERFGQIENNLLKVGPEGRYQVVVIPPALRSNNSTEKLLWQFLEHRVDGKRHYFFLANTSREKTDAATIKLRGASASGGLQE